MLTEVTVVHDITAWVLALSDSFSRYSMVVDVGLIVVIVVVVVALKPL